MGKIRIYDRNEIEFARLKTFANMVNEKTTKFFVETKNIYFDFGQDWRYTALVTEDLKEADRTWQSVNPRDYEAIITCDSFEKLNEYATKYVKGLEDGKISMHLSF